MLYDILHRFAEHRVIHEFEEILLKIIASLSSELSVEIDVGFHPCRLIKFNCAMNFLQNQLVFEGLGYVHTVPDSETEHRRKCTR